MSGLNKVQLIGNLTADPEGRNTPNGGIVSSFRVAVSRRYKDSEGNQQEEAEFFPVVTFGKLAETVQQYLAKGRSVYVEGRLKTNTWNDKDSGEKKYRTEVVANDVQFLSRPKDDDRQPVGAGASTSSGDEMDSMPF